MSYDFESEGRPPKGRRRLTVALAALVPLALVAVAVGWAVTGDEEPVASPSGSGAPQTPGTASPKPSAPKGSPSASRPALSPSSSASPGSGTDDGKQSGSGPLRGRTVVIDPGHNPNNASRPTAINRKVDIGTGTKECDTTGTATNDGYAEARFTLDVAHRLRTLLQKQGARVILTHDGDRPFGPCVDERARIGNEARADAAVSIHADGSGSGNRGFHVITPAAVNAGAADTRTVAKPARELGERIAGNFVRATGSAPSNYIGGGTGLDTRGDLGGLNLSRVPKVFVECGNMRDSRDAALLTSASWRGKAAQGISEGILSFLK